jgi:hypothetical protein
MGNWRGDIQLNFEFRLRTSVLTAVETSLGNTPAADIMAALHLIMWQDNIRAIQFRLHSNQWVIQKADCPPKVSAMITNAKTFFPCDLMPVAFPFFRTIRSTGMFNI